MKPLWLCPLGALIFIVACTPKYYQKRADKEAYKIIERKSRFVDGMPKKFNIKPTDSIMVDTNTTITLSLQDALNLALKNSRDYQTQKEDLFVEALSLSLSRWRFGPLFSAVAQGEIEQLEVVEQVAVETEGEGTNGESGDAEVETRSVKTTTQHAQGNLIYGIRKTLATGGDLTLQITTTFSRFISFADPDYVAQSVLTAELSQPLLRGFGRKVALENLTQSERNVVYQIRDFVRFRKRFSVQVAQDYFEILRLKDGIQNTENNYRNLVELRERAEYFALAGITPELQVDQAKQDELRAYASLVRAQEQYENQIDEFKITLGLPTDIILELDYDEMKELASDGMIKESVSEKSAILIALANRLDLKTAHNRVDDAERRVYVAKNALLPRLDILLQYRSESEPHKPLRFRNVRDTAVASAELELPLDRKEERNNYRIALIDLDVAQRDLEESVDRIKQQVRDAIRAINQAEQSYEIQRNSLKLAERRVESTQLLQEAGQATTRDVLEAQEDLLDAQIAVTEALVDHYNARLNLHLAMESLIVQDEGFILNNINYPLQERGG
jgi:outer membrane protein TolC